jgi:hypothetical protein
MVGRHKPPDAPTVSRGACAEGAAAWLGLGVKADGQAEAAVGETTGEREAYPNRWSWEERLARQGRLAARTSLGRGLVRTGRVCPTALRAASGSGPVANTPGFQKVARVTHWLGDRGSEHGRP